MFNLYQRLHPSASDECSPPLSVSGQDAKMPPELVLIPVVDGYVSIYHIRLNSVIEPTTGSASAARAAFRYES